MRAQKWRRSVAQSFLFLFSAPEDRLSPSSEGGRGPEQLSSVQASPWGMQERYPGDTCRREDPAWSRFLNGWGASANDHECQPRLDQTCASEGPSGLLFLLPLPDWPNWDDTNVIIPLWTRFLADSSNELPATTSFATSTPVLNVCIPKLFRPFRINGQLFLNYPLSTLPMPWQRCIWEPW